MDATLSSTEEPQNQFEIKIGRFHLKLTGTVPTAIATTGTFAIIGCCTYALLKSENLPHLLITAIKSGSIDMEVIAENEEDCKRALSFFRSAELVKHFNKQLEQFEHSYSHDEKWKVKEILLDDYKMDRVSLDYLKNAKKEALVKKLDYEEHLHSLKVGESILNIIVNLLCDLPV